MQMQRAMKVPLLPIARGKGPWLEDYEGQRYFDATSSWWVNLFGHADERTSAALKDLLDRLPHMMLAGCTHAPAVELARAPVGPDEWRVGPLLPWARWRSPTWACSATRAPL
jgi:adenosylmethionine-8-amino-7-oxononanoate aminotransferase